MNIVHSVDEIIGWTFTFYWAKFSSEVKRMVLPWQNRKECNSSPAGINEQIQTI